MFRGTNTSTLGWSRCRLANDFTGEFWGRSARNRKQAHQKDGASHGTAQLSPPHSRHVTWRPAVASSAMAVSLARRRSAESSEE